MPASDSSLVRLIPRADGSMGVHSYATGNLLGTIPACALERRGEPLPDLETQVETATARREQERQGELVAGVLLGLAVVFGFLLGLLVR